MKPLLISRNNTPTLQFFPCFHHMLFNLRSCFGAITKVRHAVEDTECRVDAQPKNGPHGRVVDQQIDQHVRGVQLGRDRNAPYGDKTNRVLRDDRGWRRVRGDIRNQVKSHKLIDTTGSYGGEELPTEQSWNLLPCHRLSLLTVNDLLFDTKQKQVRFSWNPFALTLKGDDMALNG